MKKSGKIEKSQKKKDNSVKLVNNSLLKSVNINLRSKDKDNNLLLKADNKKLSVSLKDSKKKSSINKKPLLKPKIKKEDNKPRKFTFAERTTMRNAKYLEERMFKKEQNLLKRERDIKEREANLDKWNVPNIHKNFDVSKCIVLFVRGKVATSYDAIMYHDHIRVPKLKMRWLISPNQEDLNTVFTNANALIVDNTQHIEFS